MHALTIIQGDEKHILPVSDGVNLLHILTQHGFLVDAPCQGRGKCGKCRVDLNGEPVRACQSIVNQDARIHIPRFGGSGLTQYVTTVWQDGESGLGAAVDIGTTTIAAALIDCRDGTHLASESMLNPQRVCGADVISRIAACSEGKLELLTELVREAVACLLEKLMKFRSGEAIRKVTVCGNPTMVHLLCGIDPEPIGRAPYTPVFRELREYPGAELGLPAERIIILPLASGYIGSDLICGILTMEETNETMLLVDLGTNGELALMYGGEVLCASAAAGPALEGASIECGTGGVPGAVNAVFWKDELKLQTIGGEQPTGICGSGLVDLVAMLLRFGIIDESGTFDEKSHHPLIKNLRDGRFWLTDDLWLSQQDIRQFQLAKAAICAGVEILCESAGIALEKVSSTVIAGGLGFYLREKAAQETGLIPVSFTERMTAAGNTALAGAVRCLQPFVLAQAAAIAERIQICELSRCSDFSTRFLERMGFESQQI